MLSMVTNNFMAADVRAIFISCCLFSLIGLAPGYALGFLFDIMRFGTRTLACRVALSVALSISLGPVITYFVGRWLSLDAVCLVFAGLSAYAGVAVIHQLTSGRVRFSRSLKPYTKVVALTCIWIAVAVLSLADMQIGRRLYFSVIGYDYFVRTSFTAAISNFGIPPPNPFYFPGYPVLLRYHYFWLAQAALVHHIARPVVDARQAFIGATVWSGIGLICVVALYLRFFSPLGPSGIARRSFIGVCLLAVTGLDILPTLLLLCLAQLGLVKAISPSVEWWNNQIDGWLYTMLWEPHYVAGLIACLTGFLIIWTISQDSNRRECIVAAAAAGVAFATGVGAGLYVGMVFAVFLLCWTIIIVTRRWYREACTLTAAGVIAAVLSAPFLIALREPASGGAFLQATVRSFPLGEAFFTALGFTRPWQVALGNAVLLPLNYFLELGFFLVAGHIAWRRFRARQRGCTRYELASLTMIGASAGVCTFLKSGVIQNNDLGWRGFLPAQFALLIVATDLLVNDLLVTNLWAKRSASSIATRGVSVITTALTPFQRNLLTALLILGAAGVTYDLGILRFFPLLSDAGVVPKIAWLAKDGHLGSRTYANREAYEWLRANTLPRTVIQQNPTPALQDTFYGLYSNRRTVAEDTSCGTVFGGDPRECGPIVKLLVALFSGSSGARLDSFANACDTLSIDVLIAKDTDAAWADSGSWIWQRKPLFSNRYVRLFSCTPNASNLVLTYRGKNRD